VCKTSRTRGELQQGGPLTKWWNGKSSWASGILKQGEGNEKKRNLPKKPSHSVREGKRTTEIRLSRSSSSMRVLCERGGSRGFSPEKNPEAFGIGGGVEQRDWVEGTLKKGKEGF